MGKFIKGLTLVVLVLLGCQTTASYSQKVEEDQLKAVFVYNFAHFVSFPETRISNAQAFTFCTFGDGQFKQALQLILDEQNFIGSPPQLIDLNEHNAVQFCHIIYFPQAAKNQYQQVLSELNKKAVLTVSDIKGFAQRGGMIEFVRVNNKINLIINNNKAVSLGLVIKANLLNIATLVSH